MKTIIEVTVRVEVEDTLSPEEAVGIAHFGATEFLSMAGSTDPDGELFFWMQNSSTSLTKVKYKGKLLPLNLQENL
jgi:hypothetical protein